MEYVLTAAEMQECDRRTIEEHKMDSLVLMERAAYGMAEEIRKRKPEPARVLIVSGTGNNGGDGLAAGRMLWQSGYEVTFYLAGAREKCSVSCKRQIEILESHGISLKMDETDQGILKQNEYDIIVDALFGIGLKREINGRLAELVHIINQKDAFVAACDIPSGISADTGQIRGCAVKADLTVTFAWKKRGQLLYPGAGYTGELCCVQMGITEHSFWKDFRPAALTYDRTDLSRLPAREPDGNKGSFGKVLLVAGSPNMAGAAFLSAKSCYRTGAGLVRIFTAEENRLILQSIVPEAVLHTYARKPQGLDEEDIEGLLQDLHWADCVILGPGIGTDVMAGSLVRTVLNDTELKKKVCVLDADALNLIAVDPEKQQLLKQRAAESQVIMTPHLLEFSRLTGRKIEKLREDIITNVSEYAKEMQTTVVCKDARSIVVESYGSVYINASGNDALATAGSGDVLTGIIGGLAAQGLEAYQAAALGTYIHGLSGETAAECRSRYSVMAGDLPEALGKVLGTGSG
ncbi:MAG: NAD(P)H-hydrate dehydratase [Lachnospiraceae bacterium]|nr:NAD(P)H-hydrate dehydratase [Lachnospiraceae bacterium]